MGETSIEPVSGTSFIVLLIAFYFLAPEGKSWSISQVFNVGTDNYIFKFSVAIMITPAIYLSHYLIDKYLGKKLAEKGKKPKKGFFSKVFGSK